MHWSEQHLVSHRWWECHSSSLVVDKRTQAVKLMLNGWAADNLPPAGSDWHEIPPDHMELISLQRESWTGLVVPQQVWRSAVCQQLWQHHVHPTMYCLCKRNLCLTVGYFSSRQHEKSCLCRLKRLSRMRRSLYLMAAAHGLLFLFGA